MTHEIKPCPFCGGEAWLSSNNYGNGHVHYYVECCGTGEQWPDEYGKSVEQAKEWAIRDWNKRPIEESLHTRIKELEFMLQGIKDLYMNYGAIDIDAIDNLLKAKELNNE